MAHASEQQHWYDRQGNPVYEIPSADGKKMIVPDIRHARKNGYVPGFTAVNRMIYSFGLERYKIRQGILAALTLPRNENETDESYFERLEEDRQAHAKGRAEEGTLIHTAIEQALRGETYDTKWDAHVQATLTLLDKLPDWLVGDFKTKETVKGKQERDLFFDDHIMQLVAYRGGYVEGNSPHDFYKLESGIAIPEITFASPKGYGGRIDVLRKGEPGTALSQAPLVSIIIPVDDPTDIRHKVWDESEAKRAMSMFEHALALWQHKNRYDSSWEVSP